MAEITAEGLPFRELVRALPRRIRLERHEQSPIELLGALRDMGGREEELDVAVDEIRELLQHGIRRAPHTVHPPQSRTLDDPPARAFVVVRLVLLIPLVQNPTLFDTRDGPDVVLAQLQLEAEAFGRRLATHRQTQTDRPAGGISDAGSLGDAELPVPGHLLPGRKLKIHLLELVPLLKLLLGWPEDAIDAVDPHADFDLFLIRLALVKLRDEAVGLEVGDRVPRAHELDACAQQLAAGAVQLRGDHRLVLIRGVLLEIEIEALIARRREETDVHALD
mmetsp:Transcript_109538/g.294682  ORF Transcript_109538/g.294682 Transcript_109538/m.294682 type:complete len:278 (-) Transcript_109538:1267-2100(-)